MTEQGKKDFFISYNKADKDWAEWIAGQLEETGYTTTIQAWDFRAGNNFIIEMQKATISANQTIAVLSEAYLTALYTQTEWAAAFVQDPTGEKRMLIPVRVSEVTPTGLLRTIIYIDLVGVDEGEAKSRLLTEINPGRRPIITPPPFPKRK